MTTPHGQAAHKEFINDLRVKLYSDSGKREIDQETDP